MDRKSPDVLDLLSDVVSFATFGAHANCISKVRKRRDFIYRMSNSDFGFLILDFGLSLGF